jgi:hypothetical protein
MSVGKGKKVRQFFDVYYTSFIREKSYVLF